MCCCNTWSGQTSWLQKELNLDFYGKTLVMKSDCTGKYISVIQMLCFQAAPLQKAPEKRQRANMSLWIPRSTCDWAEPRGIHCNVLTLSAANGTWAQVNAAVQRWVNGKAHVSSPVLNLRWKEMIIWKHSVRHGPVLTYQENLRCSSIRR